MAGTPCIWVCRHDLDVLQKFSMVWLWLLFKRENSIGFKKEKISGAWQFSG